MYLMKDSLELSKYSLLASFVILGLSYFIDKNYSLLLGIVLLLSIKKRPTYNKTLTKLFGYVFFLYFVFKYLRIYHFYHL